MGVKAGQGQPNDRTSGAQSTNPTGTDKNPFVVDTQGHKQTDVERKESQKKADADKAHEDFHDGIDVSTRNWTAIAAVATAILVFVGIGGTAVAIKTIRAINKQAAIMERQIMVPYRARLVVGQPKGDLTHWTFPVRNTGQVPAVIRTVKVAMQIDEMVPGEGFVKRTYCHDIERTTEVFIAAHEESPPFGVVVNFPVLPNMAQIAMVTGAIEYHVGFSDPKTGSPQIDTVRFLRIFQGDDRKWRSGYTCEEFAFKKYADSDQENQKSAD